MNVKRIALFLGGVALCFTVLSASFILSGLNHSRAAGTTLHSTSKSQSFVPTQLAHSVDGVQGNIYFGTTYGSIYALNATTGAQLWRYYVGSSVCNVDGEGSTVVLRGVVNNIAYVNTCSSTCPTRLIALQISDGSQLWCSSLPLSAVYDGRVELLGVSQGIVYVYPIIQTGDGGEHNVVYALSAKDGSLLWSFDQNPQAVQEFIDFFKIVEGVIYISLDQYSPGGNFVAYLTCALNASNGSESWCVSNALTRTLVQGVLYATNGLGNSTSLIALRASDGSQLWSYAGTFYQIFAYPNTVFAGGSSICALNSSDGTQRWCSSANAYYFRVQGGVIYTWQYPYGIQAYSATTGTLLWTNQTASIIGLGQGIAYLLTSNYHVEGINATNGSLLWNYNTVHSGTAYFAPIDGVIYYNTSHGLRALSASTGTLLWSHFAATNVNLSFQSDSSAIAYIVSNNTTTNSFTLNAYNSSNGILLWKYTIQ